jgi:hypothetical protein
MATFKVIEWCECKRVYSVEARTPEEAQEMVEEGMVDHDEEDYYDFEVQKVIPK